MTHKANGFCRMRSQIPLLPSTEFPRPTASWGGTSRFWNRTQEEPAGAPQCGRSANRFPSCLVSPRRSAVRFESGRLRTSRILATESTTLVRSESSTMTDGTPSVTRTVARSERMPLPFLGQQHLAALEGIGEDLSIFSMHQDYPLRIASFDETNQVIVAGVRAEVELLPLALDVDRYAVPAGRTL